MKKLIIVAGSTRLTKEPTEPIPALQRFDGVHARLIRKYKDQLRNVDIVFISPVYGLIRAQEKIGLKEPAAGNWRKLALTEDEIIKLKDSTIPALKRLLSKNQYDEVYVNVGKSLLRGLEGLDKMFPQTTKITYSQGRGIGPKMSHMKVWIKLQTSLNKR